MSILIDRDQRVCVQGITGREGQARTQLMLDYGTNVVAGVTPGRGGAEVLGIPVFDSVSAAVATTGAIDVSVLFVPAKMVREAAIEAIDAGVKLVVLVADRVPVWDAMAIAERAAARGAEFLGPNTLGVLSPGRAVAGMLGGRAESARQWFKPPLPTGVGIVSRSGGMSSSTGYYLGQAGVRISTIVHVGGDAVLGIRIPEAALRFENDAHTEAIVVFGEIGSSQEEELAELMRAGRVTKPVIAYIGGKAAKEGTRFSHAGAIIATVERLKRAGGSSLMSQAERDAVWTTAVTRIAPNSVRVRGHDISNLMGDVSFGAAVYLILSGALPDQRIGRLMDAILVASIDHGATPPSCLAARTVASTGASLSASVAAGIMSINRHHGGAIEDCARQLARIIARAKSEATSLEHAANATMVEFKARGERFSGFGHRIHTKDPRTPRLFELAAEAGVDGAHMAAARALQDAFAATGKPLPINVDGAIGAILADVGLDPALFNGIFMIARTPGLVAHVVEEQTREKPMRRIDPVKHAYDGPVVS